MLPNLDFSSWTKFQTYFPDLRAASRFPFAYTQVSACTSLVLLRWVLRLLARLAADCTPVQSRLFMYDIALNSNRTALS